MVSSHKQPGHEIYTYAGSILVVSLLAWACTKPGEPQPVKAQPQLIKLTERFQRDSSSQSVQFSYNADGRLRKEDYYQDNNPWFSRTYIYAPHPGGDNGGNILRTYDLAGNLISEKQYSSGRVLTEAASTYQDGRLVRSEELDYLYQIHHFSFPIQLSRKAYFYNARNQLSSEADSVFTMYECIPGTLVFRPITGPPKFVRLNRITYQYNEWGDINRQTNDRNDAFRIQTGFLSLLLNSVYLAGTITYTYEYRPDGLVKRKTAVFNDGKTPTNYTSTFDYTYSTN